MCTTPNETCLRSFFLKVFFLPFFSGAAAPLAAAAGLAIEPQFQRFQGFEFQGNNRNLETSETLKPALYVFAAAFFLLATVPLRGPLRLRALVCVRCPRTGRLRR